MNILKLKANKVKYVLFLIITFSILLNFSPNTSYACSCVAPGPVERELKESDAVFSGKVVNIVDENKSKLIKSSADPIAVTFEVEESWKGKIQKQVTVYTAYSSASCGFDFTLNQKYLVYAYEHDGTLKVFLCSRTAQLLSATDDITELRKIEKSSKPLSSDTDERKSKNQIPSENSKNNTPIYTISIIMGLALVALYITRRFKK
jgi:hypothetical protein